MNREPLWGQADKIPDVGLGMAVNATGDPNGIPKFDLRM
jgi:hypothetical protein